MILLNKLKRRSTRRGVNKMCGICNAICNDIQNTFGHRVDPNKLTQLIESSPLPIQKKRCYTFTNKAKALKKLMQIYNRYGFKPDSEIINKKGKKIYKVYQPFGLRRCR